MGIAPDGCSDLNGEYHQEESEELEDTGEAMRRAPGSRSATPKGWRQAARRCTNEQAGRGDRESRVSHGILGENVGSVCSKLVCEGC